MTREQSREIVGRRLGNRETNLLTMVKTAIYDNKASPYLQLLRHVGCEYGDFQKMVDSDGVEPTLKKLCQLGVYVSVEEFKGKEVLIRNGSSFEFTDSDFDNPFLSGHLESRSGGSRSAGTRTVYDFDFLTDNVAVYSIARLDAYDALRTPVAIWMPIMPGIGPSKILTYAKVGKPPAKWFSQTGQMNSKSAVAYRMATNYIVYVGRILGGRFAKPEFVSLDKSLRVAKWLATTIKDAGGCLLDTYTTLL